MAALRKSGVAIRPASSAELAAFAEASARSRKAQATEARLGAKVLASIED